MSQAKRVADRAKENMEQAIADNNHELLIATHEHLKWICTQLGVRHDLMQFWIRGLARTASHTDSAECLKYLLANGWPLKGVVEAAALGMVARGPATNVLRWLLATWEDVDGAGAHAGVAPAEEERAMHAALESGNVEAVRIIEQLGCDYPEDAIGYAIVPKRGAKAVIQHVHETTGDAFTKTHVASVVEWEFSPIDNVLQFVIASGAPTEPASLTLAIRSGMHGGAKLAIERGDAYDAKIVDNVRFALKVKLSRARKRLLVRWWLKKAVETAHAPGGRARLADLASFEVDFA